MVSQVFPPVIFTHCGVRAYDTLVDSLIVPGSGVMFQVSSIVIIAIGIVATAVTADGALGEIALFPSRRHDMESLVEKQHIYHGHYQTPGIRIFTQWF